MGPGRDIRPNRRGARSREAVLEAAERVMSEHGYEAATLARIVELSGVPISSVYHYFGSKDGLLLAVMERGAQRFFTDLPPLARRLDPPEQHLARLGNIARALNTQPDFLRLLIVMAAQPPKLVGDNVNAVITRIRDEALRLLREQIALAFDIDSHSAAAQQLALFSLAAIDGAFLASQADEAVTIDGMLAHLPTALNAMHRATSSEA